MYTIVLAEKPSVARDIARVLKATEANEGFLRGNGYIVTWAFGHLVTLKEPDELDARFKKWKREDLPILPDSMDTKVIPKTRKQFSIIKKLLNDKDTEGVICATDSGREGELIFRYIYEQAGCRKPVKRLWISSMTEEAIREGFADLKPSAEYDALYTSARCRADADWLIGMNATRAYSLRYGVLLSIGRVQTPTLSMLVRRRREIDQFIPSLYYTVKADFGDYTGDYVDGDDERRIADKEKAKEIADRVKGREGTVSEIKKENKTERPPLLYDLTSLQRDANNRFGFTAKNTLELAQKLYEEHKLLTYPRTDSRYLSHDMLQPVQKILNQYDGEWREMGRQALQYGVKLSPRVFDDDKLTDHHAIIPTGRSPERVPKLTKDEKRLFDLVARRLAAAFYPNYEYQMTRVITAVQQDRFLSTGKTELNLCWRCLYADEEKKKEEKIPVLQEGEKRTCIRAAVKEEKTKPPKEYTDASLLTRMEHADKEIDSEKVTAEMKRCSLGTPATRAAILERLIQVGYVQRKGKNLIATKKGVQLIDAVPLEISSPEMTGRWETALEEIAAGKDREGRFREGISRLTEYVVKSSDSAPQIQFEREEKRRGRTKAGKTLAECPACGKGRIAENSKAFYCTRFREGCAFTIWKDALVKNGGPLLDEKLMKLCLLKGDVQGSTGTIHYKDRKIAFEKKGM